ncbi:MAG: hypothetical protein HAW58_03805, partial [Candidatus Thioglobus sp.]|nr:hypothetical protein [Candidatus Thioglobus sp.]
MPPVVSDARVIWAIVDAGSTGASINGNVLSTSAVGTVVVRATSVSDTGVTITRSITINDVPVETVNITNPDSVGDGFTLPLTSTSLPAGSAQDVVWTIQGGGTNIASIDTSGNAPVIHGISAPGTVIVVATSANGVIGTQSFTVNPTLVTGISITSDPAVLHGEMLTLTADIEPAEATTKTITWSVQGGNNNIASIDGDVLHGIGTGSVVIVATADGGTNITGTQNFTVNSAPVTSITIGTPHTVGDGRLLTLTAVVLPAEAAQTVNWTIQGGNNNIASINGVILVGLSPGNVTVTASATDSSSVTAEQRFTVLVTPVTAVSITSLGPIVNGSSLTLTATVSPAIATNKEVSWGIDGGGNNAIASIDSNNVLHALSVGTVSVRVTSTNGDGGSSIESQRDIQITPILVSSIAITSPSSVINGLTQNLVATVLPANAADKTVSWSITAGTGSATLTGNVLTGTGVGEVTVVARANDTSGISQTQPFTIVVTPVPVTSVSIISALAPIGTDLTLTANVLPDNATTPTVSWAITSAGTTGASISGNVLSTTAAGEVIVTASADGITSSPQTIAVRFAGPATLQAVANGAPNQVLIYWAAVANAANYKFYQTTADLSALAGGTAENLASASPAPAAITVNGTSTVVVLTGSEVNNFLVTAIISGGGESFASPQASARANDFVFTPVAGGGTDTIWMDRNLGAERVATSSTDTMAFGDLYQWGRRADGHQLRTSGITTTLATDISPGHADFITNSGNNIRDWTDTSTDADGSARQAVWGSIDGSGVCPTGFKVPSEAELEAERVSWASNNLAGAFASNLKLIGAGHRSGAAPSSNTSGSYWSSSVANVEGQSGYLSFGDNASTTRTTRYFAFSVRCIRDSNINITVALGEIPVTAVSITSAAAAVAGIDLTLAATIAPAGATDKTITWAITDAGTTGATLSNGNVLSTTNAGTVEITAAAGGITTPQTIIVESAGPATLQAVANGVANQVIIYWAAVANADNYKLYQTTADLSAFAGGSAANLASASPAPTAITVNETSTTVTLSGSEVNNFLVTAIIGGVESLASTAKTSARANDFVFETVAGGGTDTIWMDRNLGAARVATADEDSEAYGDLYQWGRPSDGHQLRGDSTTTLASNISPEHSQFILVSGDWTAAGVDADGSARQAVWGSIDGSGICPTGFRIPTSDEMRAEGGGSWATIAEAFASPLKFTNSGSRNSGSQTIRIGDLYIWLADSFQALTTDDFADGSISLSDRANGASVRCIRDSSITLVVPVASVSITSANTVEAGTDLTLTAEVLPATATDKAITWAITAAGSTGASITGNVLSAAAAGTVEITATAGEISNSQTITITPAPIPVASISINSADTVEAGTDLTLTANVLPADATDPAVTWSILSRSGAEATINGNVLTAISGGGTVRISATAADGRMLIRKNTFFPIGH